MSPSFPSGHAMEFRHRLSHARRGPHAVAETRITKVYLMGVAMLLTTIVGNQPGVPRVHYPTDVVGGWIVGLVWASICWLFAQHFEVRAGLKAEKKKVE
jgi:undecaprenyl-diphosphatase